MEIASEIPALREAASVVSQQAPKGPVDAAKLEEASRQFEALFLKQFIGEALKPLLHNTPGSQMAGAGIYEHMITDVISENLSKSGDFGFSTMLQAQLASPDGPREQATSINKGTK